MTAIISAACTFPSGPTLPLADIAFRLHFSLMRKHPLCVDRSGYPIKACYFPDIIYATPEERFRQLARQVLTELTGHQPALKTITPGRIWLLLPPLSRPAMSEGVATAIRETIAKYTGWYHSEICVLHGGQAEIATAIETIRQNQCNTIEILMAVDSWLPSSSLMWLDAQNLLHGSLRYFRGILAQILMDESHRKVLRHWQLCLEYQTFRPGVLFVIQELQMNRSPVRVMVSVWGKG